MGGEKNSVENKRLYWKGIKVSEKDYKNKLRLKESIKIIQEKRKNSVKRKVPDEFLVDDAVEGRRYFNVKHFVRQLFCKNCKTSLEMINIKNERQMTNGNGFSI